MRLIDVLRGCLLGLALMQLTACAQNLEEQPQLQQAGKYESNNSTAVEKAALLKFKAGVNDSDALLDSWLDANHVCSWKGVGCDADSHVISLELTFQLFPWVGLRGTIPWATLFQLSKLKVLVLSNNRFRGPLGPVPDTIEVLDVSDNWFLNGTIPANWARLPALQELSLHTNLLTGTVPSDWSQTALKKLLVGANMLEGPLPHALPPSLTELSFGVNRLTGTIPSPLPPLLTTLKLSSNYLSGPIPPLPPELVHLSIRNNSFTGKFPMLNSNIDQCYADDNQLSGQVPPNLWGAGANLSSLSAARNALTGTLPPDLVLPLTNLDFSGNALNGTLPLGSWAIPSSLNLSGNALSGNMQDWAYPLQTNSGFYVLDLSSNLLTGSIPLDFALNATIPYVFLSNNSLTGTLPDAWASTATYLQVDNNYLEGTLPLWNRMPSAIVVVTPQKQAGFCGKVPDSPAYAMIPTVPPPPPDEAQRPGNDSTPQYTGYDLPYSPEITYDYPSSFYEPVHTYLDSLPECGEVSYPASSAITGSGSGSSADGGGSSDGGTTSVGVIVGGVVAGSVAIAVIVGGVVWWRRRRYSRRTYAHSARTAQKTSPSPAGLADTRSDGQETNTESNVTGATSVETGSLPRDQVLRLVIKAAEENGPSISASEASLRGRLGQGLKEWEIEFDKLQLVKQIGEGAFGRVYVALWRETKVAVKILLNPSLDIYSADVQLQALTLSNPMLVDLCKEAGLMASLRHPNIVGFLGVCSMPPAVVTEFCSRGSLGDILRAAKQMPSLAAKLTWQRKLRMLQDTARGVLYLHERQPPLIHRDLKSPNLLVNEHWQVKVADFNVSKLMEDAVAMSSAAVTNPRWLAPEVLSGEPATMKSDSYAYGLIMWELLTHEVPFGSENHFQLIKFIANGGRPPIPEPRKLPGNKDGEQLGRLGDYIALMQRCWAQAPEERPSFQEIVRLVRNIIVQTSKRAQSGGSDIG